MSLDPVQILASAGLPPRDLYGQPSLYMNTFTVSRLLALRAIYLHVINVAGIAMEFGVRWGQDLAWFHNLRALYEPHYPRLIVGFDSFSGFPSVHANDAGHQPGELAVTEGYEEHLDALMRWHEANIYSPGDKRFRIIKGDVIEMVPGYLAEHPETIIALAYFDLDLYEPTKACLEVIRPYLTRGSIIAFDELVCPDWPGETMALREALGLDRYRIRRSPESGLITYCVVE